MNRVDAPNGGPFSAMSCPSLQRASLFIIIVSNRAQPVHRLLAFNVAGTLPFGVCAGAIETFEADKEVYLVMRLCTGGDLHTRAPYSEKAVVDIISKVRFARFRAATNCP